MMMMRTLPHTPNLSPFLSHVCRENCKLTALLTQLEQKIQRKRVNKINTKSSSDSTRLRLRLTPTRLGRGLLPWLACSALSIFPAFSSVCCAFHLKRLELIFEWLTRQAGQPKRATTEALETFLAFFTCQGGSSNSLSHSLSLSLSGSDHRVAGLSGCPSVGLLFGKVQ